MTKHTPGPWIVNGNAIEARDEEGRGLMIASLYDESDNALPSSENKANADLIAVSPKLLQAAKRLLGTPWHGDMRVHEAFGALENAIKEAEGRT